VIEAGVPGRGRRRARAVPRVQADVVVVVAGGQEDHVDPGFARVGGYAEAEHVAVEPERAVQIRDAQVHVSDAHRGVDGFVGGVSGFVVHGGQSVTRRALGHRCIRLTGRRGPVIAVEWPDSVGAQTHVIAIEGKLGSGTSPLVDHQPTAAEADGAGVLEARAWGFESDLPCALGKEGAAHGGGSAPVDEPQCARSLQHLPARGVVGLERVPLLAALQALNLVERQVGTVLLGVSLRCAVRADTRLSQRRGARGLRRERRPLNVSVAVKPHLRSFSLQSSL